MPSAVTVVLLVLYLLGGINKLVNLIPIEIVVRQNSDRSTSICPLGVVTRPLGVDLDRKNT